MPRELIAIGPRQPVLREYEDPPLGPSQVRIRAEFASPKHGTGFVFYRGSSRAIGQKYDREWGCLVPADAEEVAWAFPRRLGNMAVGTVVEVGPAVTRFRPGQRVFGHLPIRETYTVHESRVDPLPGELAPEAAVCLDPALMALALRDAGIRLGDAVAVFGLGAIGLLAVQLARQAGAAQVIAVDPLAPRRELAVRFGADLAMAPGDDAGLAIRRLAPPGAPRAAAPEAVAGPPTSDVLSLDEELLRLGEPRRSGRHVTGGFIERDTQWGQTGVDVAVEATGNPRALHEAIRATRFGGTICLLSYYADEARGLYLGEEFHLNRLQLVSCRSESQPLRDAPGWTLERLAQIALLWLTSGRLRTDGILTPIVTLDEAPEAFRQVDEHPETSIKLGVRFP
ncbi:MAG TPA: zinc-binding alcohol dehydrogenase [Chloroflexota bacterium]|jgi:threonine dehydrogenase-like Zn-dependent dehydrogenase|nr:zinc-binding alcohol dehydrogenase [Chloroflexota bacterium]